MLCTLCDSLCGTSVCASATANTAVSNLVCHSKISFQNLCIAEKICYGEVALANQILIYTIKSNNTSKFFITCMIRYITVLLLFLTDRDKERIIVAPEGNTYTIIWR